MWIKRGKRYRPQGNPRQAKSNRNVRRVSGETPPAPSGSLRDSKPLTRKQGNPQRASGAYEQPQVAEFRKFGGGPLRIE